jgi:hypothetical protein
MEKLENKILKKIYSWETKNTIVDMLIKIVSFLFVGFIIWLLSTIIIEILQEQKTFSLMDVFQEDFEVIKKYFFDIVYIFYQETPKIVLFLLIIGVAIIIFVSFKIINNFSKIRNKIRSLLKYWLAH